MLTALAVVTATIVGTMVGVEFAVAVFVNPILLRLPAGASLEARADGFPTSYVELPYPPLRSVLSVKYDDSAGVEQTVDPASYQHLKGATLDYKDGLQGAGFAINNPNAQRSCGCGQSFS